MGVAGDPPLCAAALPDRAMLMAPLEVEFVQATRSMSKQNYHAEAEDMISLECKHGEPDWSMHPQDVVEILRLAEFKT